MNILLFILIFIGEISMLFFLSRAALQHMYGLLRKILKKDTLIVLFISLFYLPGTIIHELSHYFMALILNLHPREIQLFPVIEGRTVKLGHVLYEKNPNDFIRSIIVGVAPFFGALITLWLIIQSRLFPGAYWWETAGFGYLIIAITANMFSSQQDLIDILYVIPIALIGGFLFYLFPIHFSPEFINTSSFHIFYFIQTLQFPLLFSLLFHAILILVLRRFK